MMRATCCICSDLLDEVHDISTTSCGHVHHSSCLLIWLGQSGTCPICRTLIKPDNLFKLYFNFPATAAVNSSVFENEISNLKSQLSAKDTELIQCKKEKEETGAVVEAVEKKASDLQQAIYKSESLIAELRLKVTLTAKLEAKVVKLEQMNKALIKDLQTMNNIKSIVSGTIKDSELILQNYLKNRNEAFESSKQLATFCSVLKKELVKAMDSKEELHELNSKLQQENSEFAIKVKWYEDVPVQSFKNNYSHYKRKAAKGNFDKIESVSSVSSSEISNSMKQSYHIDCCVASPPSVPFNRCILMPNRRSVRGRYARGINLFTTKEEDDDWFFGRIRFDELRDPSVINSTE